MNEIIETSLDIVYNFGDYRSRICLATITRHYYAWWVIDARGYGNQILIINGYKYYMGIAKCATCPRTAEFSKDQKYCRPCCFKLKPCKHCFIFSSESFCGFTCRKIFALNQFKIARHFNGIISENDVYFNYNDVSVLGFKADILHGVPCVPFSGTAACMPVEMVTECARILQDLELTVIRSDVLAIVATIAGFETKYSAFAKILKAMLGEFRPIGKVDFAQPWPAIFNQSNTMVIAACHGLNLFQLSDYQSTTVLEHIHCAHALMRVAVPCRKVEMKTNDPIITEILSVVPADYTDEEARQHVRQMNGNFTALLSLSRDVLDVFAQSPPYAISNRILRVMTLLRQNSCTLADIVDIGFNSPIVWAKYYQARRVLIFPDPRYKLTQIRLKKGHRIIVHGYEMIFVKADPGVKLPVHTIL